MQMDNTAHALDLQTGKPSTNAQASLTMAEASNHNVMVCALEEALSRGNR